MKNDRDVRAAGEFVLRLGREIASRVDIPHGRIRYFNGMRLGPGSLEEGFTLSHGNGLSRAALRSSPRKVLQPRDEGRFRVGIAVLIRRFELTLFPSCLGVVFELCRSGEGRFVIPEPVGRFSQGGRHDPQLYRRVFNWNEANIADLIASFRG